MMYGYGWNGGNGWNGGFSILMMLGMAIFWIGIIVLAIYFIRRLTGQQPLNYHGYHQGNIGQSHEAMEILRKRFANGEISTEEFEKMKEVLK